MSKVFLSLIFPKASASLATRLGKLQQSAETLRADSEQQIVNLALARDEITQQIGQASHVKAITRAIGGLS